MGSDQRKPSVRCYDGIQSDHGAQNPTANTPFQRVQQREPLAHQPLKGNKAFILRANMHVRMRTWIVSVSQKAAAAWFSISSLKALLLMHHRYACGFMEFFMHVSKSASPVFPDVV
jgi:hypothetical protein